MKYIVPLIFLVTSNVIIAQSTSFNNIVNTRNSIVSYVPQPDSLSRFKRWSVFSGLHLNFHDTTRVKDSFLFFEAGVMRSIYSIPRFASLNIYSSNEFKIGGENFIIGPKIGSYIQILMFTIGLETIYYTDFNEESLRLSIQALGIGTESFKLSINPHIILYDSGIQGIGNGSFSFTINLFNLYKKETILK